MPIKTYRIATRFCALSLFLAVALLAQSALAETKVVVAAPFTGEFAPIGTAFSQIAGEIVTSDALITIDTGCDAKNGAEIALSILSANPTHVVGFPCIDVFDAVVPALNGSAITVMPVGLQAKNLTEHNGVTVLRVAPIADTIAQALIDLIAQEWRDQPIAIIDDGTLSGRQFATAVEAGLASQTITPIFRDTYRPLLENQSGLIRRLQRAGATKIVIGGDAFDAAIMGADADRLGVDLMFAGGTPLLSTENDGTLSEGTLVATALPLADLFQLAISTALGRDARLSFDADGEPKDNLTVVYRVTDGMLVPIEAQPSSPREG